MTEGFLTIKESQSTSRPNGKVLSCASCGRYKHAKSPKMKPWGNFKKEIMIIGEFPELLDDERNKMWQDKEGRYLKTALSRLGIDLFEDCVSINAVNCYTDSTPSNYEIDCCRSVIVSRQIKDYMPLVIIVLGDMALYSVIGGQWPGDLKSIDRWRGFCIPDAEHKCWICPTYAPFDIMDADSVAELIWTQDLKAAVEKTKVKFPTFKKPIINVIEDLSVLDSITKGSVAFDYETTGIKPHAKGHKIICASVAVSENMVYVFMMPEDKNKLKPFLNLLTNKDVKKYAHNMKFEQTWSTVILKTDVINWDWDSMLAAHIIDNRPNITGLKFQTYVNFGVVDYSSDVAPWLKSEGKDGNAKNRIEELVSTPGGRNKLLQYCAYDSIYEYRLAALQRGLILNNMPF